MTTQPLNQPSRYVCLLPSAMICVLIISPFANAQWPQWGGPNRNFIVPDTSLNTTWPADGPKELWSKPIGDGYATISVAQNMLFTMHRQDEHEIVLALDPDTGDTKWQYTYAAPLFKKLDRGFGVGPRSSPLIIGDLVFTVGITAKLHALNLRTGKVVWSHDMMKEFNANKLMWGYAASPIAFKDTIILPVGGKGYGVMAFRQKTGEVVWSNLDIKSSYASPLLIDVDGQQQVVIPMTDEIVAVDPTNGKLLWRHPHKTSYNVNASMPLWGKDNILFVSSAYNTGSRALKLSQTGGKTTVNELWHHSKMQIHFGSAIRVKDYIYASTGGNGPTFFACVNAKTGKMAFRKRGLFGKAQLLQVGDKFLILDEDGQLVLVSATPDEVIIHAKAGVLQRIAWTVPTLVGRKLYIRDRKTIRALALESL